MDAMERPPRQNVGISTWIEFAVAVTISVAATAIIVWKYWL